MNINEITIKTKFIDQKKLKAIIAVDFEDIIVRGFRVMESNYKNDYGDELWLTPPSYQDSGGKYHPIFFMPDKSKWQELKKLIWEEFYKQRDEYYKKQFDLKDDNDS